MRKKALMVLAIGVILLPRAALGQEQEAGQYERKSISYLNALWLLDPTTRALQPGQVNYILDKVKKTVSMPRFDYNPLPQPLLLKFMDRANRMGNLTIDDLALILEEELVPLILRILDTEKELRAAHLLTEQQKNSFITDKAKELGVTGEQMERIMNSAYLYLPVISHYLMEKTGKADNETWKCTARMGILWYGLSTKGGQARVSMLVKNMTTSFGMARKKNLIGGTTYSIDGKVVNAKQFAFRSMIRNGVNNLLVATQGIPEFRLSGQILETGGMNVGFDLGKTEGLKVDDRYIVMEQVETPVGTIEEEQTGWILTKSVADTGGKEGYKSKARIIGGAPGIGNVLREFPRLPIDIRFGFKAFPVSIKYVGDSNIPGQSSRDSLKITAPAAGAEILALYNIGRAIGLSQLFLGFGYGIGVGGAKGNDATIGSEVEGLTASSFEVPLVKRMYFRRVAVDLGASLTIQQCQVRLKSTGTIQRTLVNSTMGFTGGGGVGFALSPSLLFSATGFFQANGESKDWEVNRDGQSSTDITLLDGQAPLSHTGVGAHLGLTWSPPALPFDPVGLLRGSIGL